MYSVSGICAASVPISIFMCLWAIDIFLGSVHIFFCNRRGGPILEIVYINLSQICILFPKHNYNVLSPSFYTHMHICERFIYTISRIGPPLLLQINMWIDPRNISIAHRHMNMSVETGRKNIIIMFWKYQFHFWEYINGNQTFILDSHRHFILHCRYCQYEKKIRVH